MYGVPADLPVERFVGDFLSQICIGMDGVHFNFGRSGTISVGSRWELVDSEGNLIDCACDHDARDAYRLHVLLNKDVTKSFIVPLRSFSSTFSSGHRLTVYDDSSQYESFSIQPGNIFV